VERVDEEVPQPERSLEQGRPEQQDARLLGAVFDSLHDAVVVTSTEGIVLQWNAAAERIYGYSRTEAVGQSVALLHEPGAPAPFGDLLSRAVASGYAEADRKIRLREGSSVFMAEAVSLVPCDGDTPSLLVGISRDVSERSRLQRELEAHVRRLDDAQRLARVGSWEWDLRGDGEVWSAEYCRILGIDEGTEGSYALYLDRLHPQDRDRVQAQIELFESGRPLEYETRIVRPDGEVRWLAQHGVVETDAQGVPVRKSGTAQDITERKAAEDELERLALTDALTGLANRDRFTTVLQGALDEVEESGSVGLLLLDLDGFKDVNDGIGHDAGDLVLQEVARRVRPVLREGDEVARLGGDEFAVVLPDVGDVEQAIAMAASVRACLEAPFDLDGITVHVGGSVGIAVAHQRTDPGVLLKQADVAMYRAKTLSSGWAVFEPDQDDLAAGRLRMATDLRATIEQGELDVVYQPILDTRSRRVSSFEALARWQHPEKGFIPPDQFIPLAEQGDLIVPLTRLVLRKAVAACAAWRSAGHDLRVAVNLSVQVLETEDPCVIVVEALADAGLDAQHLVLEITESSLAHDGETLNGILRALRELGVTLVIDDFGTGYSAMSYLKQLPVAELKIDRSFVHDIATDARDLAIVRSLVRLAHSLDLRVVAEGVETLPALEVLTGLGCDFAQGYGIARPMPANETLGWLSRCDAQTPPGADPRTPSDLLVVDDSSVVRAKVRALAEQAGWRVREAASAEEALVEVEQAIPDVVILDHYMSGMSGMQAVPALRVRGLDGPILLFTQFLSDAIPSLRVPLDVWPVSKKNPEAVLELLSGYRASTGGVDIPHQRPSGVPTGA
jgi:diguanylate cyclase (GGDEF)-like protein/PAS domain S-box-containing protein